MLAATLCLVVAISDGDTLKARCGEPGAYEQLTIRLAEIDAPEKAQPYGQRSRQALATLCFQAWATIKPQARDRYGRTVGRVECAGNDASSEQVRAGLAWFFPRYGKDASVRGLEVLARDSRLGLWADASPVPPWEWRRAMSNQKGEQGAMHNAAHAQYR
jgi:endonuclease YncB( thermonuclease family)